MVVVVATGVAQGQGGSLAHVKMSPDDSQEFSHNKFTLHDDT